MQWTVIVGLTLALSGCDGAALEEDSGGESEGMSMNSGTAGDDDGGGGDGGGDDGGGGGDEVPNSSYCSDVSSWDTQMVEFEEDVLVIVNEVRAAGASCGGASFAATGPLTMNPELRCAARVHSKDMLERGYFDHTNPDGEDPFVRMNRAGYDWFTAGENIAAGQPTPSEVMQGWMDSPGHCRNIMSPDFADIGVGAFAGEGGAYGLYWTQVFGDR